MFFFKKAFSALKKQPQHETTVIYEHSIVWLYYHQPEMDLPNTDSHYDKTISPPSSPPPFFLINRSLLHTQAHFPLMCILADPQS